MGPMFQLGNTGNEVNILHKLKRSYNITQRFITYGSRPVSES
jgi:hypothetical protein